MAKASPSNPLRYIVNRQYVQKCNFTKALIRERLNCARSLFRKDLLAHYGCVNAIEFSSRGDLLVSGGDDRRVLIWNVEQAVQGIARTVAMRWQHNSNIFCLGFDSTNSKVFSAGNDDQVIVHDAITGEAVNFFLHEQPVYGLSIDPLNDNVFASACDDGRVLLYDIREPASSEPFCLASYTSSFNAVMFNPMEPRILTTANSKEGVGLWDVRKPCQILLKYGKNNISQSCMSVRFNHSGTHILALRRRLPPVLYAIHSPEHVCQFDHPGYYNSCTMKSCCFAGGDDEYVLSGSDDFGLYMWKIPCSEEKDQWVDRAHMILRGHRSIVNQVRYNPSSCIVASSGVEKLIKFWSPFSLPESSGSLLTENEPSDGQRKVFTHEEYISLILRSGEFMTHDYSHKSTKEDPRMMAFFDSLVQREIEGWSTDESASTEMSVREVAGSASESDSPLSDTPVTALTAALVEALEGQANDVEPSIEPSDDTVEAHSVDAQNRISQLIARKRAQLMRLARSRNGEELDVIRPSRTRKLCLIERSSDSSDSGKELFVDAEDTSSQKSSDTVDTNGCESEYHNGKAGSSRSKYCDYKSNVESRKRNVQYYMQCDSSDDEDWYLQQKRKRKAENWPSDSSESDTSVVNDNRETITGSKSLLNNKNKLMFLKERGSDSETTSSDTDDGKRRKQSCRLKRKMGSKTGKFNNSNSARVAAFKQRSKTLQNKRCDEVVQEIITDDAAYLNAKRSCSFKNENDAIVPTRALDKEALMECTVFNDETNIPMTPNHNSNFETSFQDAETPDSGIASTSSPFSRPSSNSSHRSSSPQNKSPEEVGEASCSVIHEPCSGGSADVESPPSRVLGSDILFQASASTSNGSSSRNQSDFFFSENRNNSDWMAFQRFRNRVNRTKRIFRKHCSDDSDSN